MTKKAQKTVHIKWVRSWIGFSYRAKVMIRSLGLRRLHQVVEREDTPQVRGLVAKIPHFVQVIGEVPAAAWPSVPEYTVSAPEKKAAAKEPPKPSGEVAGVEAAGPARSEQEQPVAAVKRAVEETAEERAAPSKSAAAKQRGKAAGAEGAKSAKATKAIKKEKPAAAKQPKPPAKGKK